MNKSLGSSINEVTDSGGGGIIDYVTTVFDILTMGGAEGVSRSSNVIHVESLPRY
jgi:hypothetical protein